MMIRGAKENMLYARWLGGGGASCLLVIVGTGSARFCARASPTQYPASVIKIHVNIKPTATANDILPTKS